MTLPPRPALAALLFTLGLAACAKADPAAGEADAEKKAHEAAVGDLKQPVARISAYLPYARYPETHDKFYGTRHGDLEKSTLCAANEIRYAANRARQTLEVSSAAATKDLQAALKGVTGACADAAEPDALPKCDAAVKALDASLEKTSAAAAAMGVTAKYPRVGPEAVTDEAKAAMASFLKAKGPGANERAYVEKRSDPAVSAADLLAVCQAAAGDASDAARVFDKAEESIRLIAVMRKMVMDGNCRILEATQTLGKDLTDCRGKKAKTTDCKIVCSKVRAALDEGLPAATFAPMEKDYGEICSDKK